MGTNAFTSSSLIEIEIVVVPLFADDCGNKDSLEAPFFIPWIFIPRCLRRVIHSRLSLSLNYFQKLSDKRKNSSSNPRRINGKMNSRLCINQGNLSVSMSNQSAKQT